MVILPWLSILWLLPLVGAVLIVLMPAEVEKLAKWTGLFISVLVLLVAVDRHGRVRGRWRALPVRRKP